MRHRVTAEKRQYRLLVRTLCVSILLSAPAQSQRDAAPKSPKPLVSIDLRPLGAAPDLFTSQSDSKYPQRAIASLFWLGDSRIAVAFSSSRRWSSSEKPEPLRVRLLLFDSSGKQLNERDWSIGADGPEAKNTLDIAPGPGNSILVIHGTTAEASAAGSIPEGDFIQVLNADASPRQDFYVPASSSAITGSTTDPRLLLQTFYSDKHTSLAWWSGNPLKPETRLDLPPGSEETLAGPGVAARPVCPPKTLMDDVLNVKEVCSGIRVFRPAATPWTVTGQPGLSLAPRCFVRPTALLVEKRDPNGRAKGWFIAHPDETQTQLPPLPKSLQTFSVTGVSTDANRFSIDSFDEIGLCGVLALYCNDGGRSRVIDIAANRIVLEKSLSLNGGQSVLSPDGKRLAIFDRNRLEIYAVE
jgi:hypothetical protein